MNRTRITIACPAAHTDDANHLAMALGGATDIFAADNKITGYIAVDRALTSQEEADLTAYLEGLV